MQHLNVEAMYGLVLVVDPGNDAAEVPEGVGQCSSTSSCVAVPVRPYVDGPVSLWLGLSVALGDGVAIFSGWLDTPGYRLGIELPEGNRPMLIDVDASITSITIAVDDPVSTAEVWVRVNGAERSGDD